MPIVYGIIQQHNGIDDIESEPGKGTTSRIYLSLIEGNDDDDTKTESDVRSYPKGGDETVLLAEDDIIVRSLLKATLEDNGYTVLDAGDGAEAEQIFSANSETIDLLLFDVIMPKVNGKEAFDKIKKVKPGIKVLFMSGYTAEIIDFEKMAGTGMNFVSKPVLPDTILRTIREVLE